MQKLQIKVIWLMALIYIIGSILSKLMEEAYIYFSTCILVGIIAFFVFVAYRRIEITDERDN